MKKISAIILVVALLAFGLAQLKSEEKKSNIQTIQLGNLKIGFVNLQRALQESERGKEVIGKLQQEVNQAQERLNKEKEEIDKLEKEYQEKQSAWDEPTRQSKLTEIQLKKQKLAQEAQSLQLYYQKRQNEQIKPILDELNQVISEIGKKQGYAVIFDLSGMVLYLDNRLDITDKIIKAYNLKK